MEIFENPLFIVILIGIISSLFGRNKKDQEQQKKRKQVAKQTKQRTKNVSTSPPNEWNQIQNVHTGLSSQLKKAEKDKSNMKSFHNKNKKQKPLALHMHSAAKGVIWSVILDEPRSKKPHRSNFIK